MTFLLLAVLVPNLAVTPGAITDMPLSQICSTKWGRDVRHVGVAKKREVARLYGLPFPIKTRVEYDHLIPRELGGADVVENLWPQDWGPARHIKDPLENRLHKLVCAGQMTLADAQDQMRHWSTP